jgi:hypothetical protein
MSLFDKAKDAAKKAMKDRDRVEDVADKGVDLADDRTGGKVPDQVRDGVDRIDGKEG